MPGECNAVEKTLERSPKDSFQFLIADDDQETREVLRAILSKNGYLRIDEAGTGEDALRALKEKDYHVVLLDKRMPKMDGLEVLKTAMPIQPGCQFIMISAYESIESVIETMNLGSVAFIDKPMKNINTLLEKVEAAIQVVEARREYQSMVDQLNGTGAPPENAREETDEGEDTSL